MNVPKAVQRALFDLGNLATEQGVAIVACCIMHGADTQECFIWGNATPETRRDAMEIAFEALDEGLTREAAGGN